jgi:hypothetical protein
MFDGIFIMKGVRNEGTTKRRKRINDRVRKRTKGGCYENITVKQREI